MLTKVAVAHDAGASLAVAEALLAEGATATTEDYGRWLAEAGVEDSGHAAAAMRAGACGFLGAIDQLLAAARAQALATDETVDGVTAAQAVALAVHCGVYRRASRPDLPEWLRAHLPDSDWREPRQRVVHGALGVVLRNDRFGGLLEDIVGFGADADAVAAIAAAVASAFDDIDQAVPYLLWAGLDGGPRFRDRLTDADTRLQALARDQGAPR
ncbi:MAG: draG [Caulobacter sp.]|jgi:ADP-ribosylglycohydrolase|nr:draG [Caulobacter sp.]